VFIAQSVHDYDSDKMSARLLLTSFLFGQYGITLDPKKLESGCFAE